MKKFILLLISLFLIAGAAAAQGVGNTNFESMRTVIIAQTTRQGDATRYMTYRLKQPFRIPYYDQKEISDMLSPGEINADALQRIAQSNNADIVLVPLVQRWYWEEYHTYWLDEMITEYSYYLTIYAYNRQKNTFHSYSVNGYDRDSSSVLNQQQAVLSDAMDRLMEKLPYKRIPSDISRTSLGNNTPLSIRTTDGGAKILTNTDTPIMM